MLDTFQTHSGGCSAECQSGDGTALNVSTDWNDLSLSMDAPAMLGAKAMLLTMRLSTQDAARLGMWLIAQSATVHAQGRLAG